MTQKLQEGLQEISGEHTPVVLSLMKPSAHRRQMVELDEQLTQGNLHFVPQSNRSSTV